MKKIGIISGSVRSNRHSAGVAQWVATQAEPFASDDVAFEVVSLADYELPVFDGATVPAMANGNYDNEKITAWGQKIASLDAFIFVTPEYNHGVPGGLKNAVDTLAPEWMDKVVSFVSYGVDGGVRAVEQWRLILANFNMYDLRQTVSLSLFEEFGADGFAPNARRAQEVAVLLEQLVSVTKSWPRG